MLGVTEVTVGSVDVTTFTTAVAVTDVSETDVAVTVTALGDGTVAGAVYVPRLGSIVPIPVRVVESDHVTLRQVVFEVVLQPGLLTVAEKVKCSPVPIVAEAGVIEMLIPVMIVTVAVSTFVVSA